MFNRKPFKAISMHPKKQTSLFRKNEFSVFLVLVIAIFVSETLIMLLLRVLPHFSTWAEAILDSSILSLCIFPVIYFFLFKPLRESIADRKLKENRFQTLIQNMGEGVIICDTEEKFMFANTVAEQLFGVATGELLGESLGAFFSKENFQRIVQETEKRRTGETGLYETEILLRNGEIKSILVTSTPQFEDGVLIGTLAILRDISELKKAEEAIKYERNLLRALIDNLPDAVYVKDLSYKKLLANPVDLRYMGLHSEAEIIGKTDHEIYPAAIADSSMTDDQTVMLTGNPYINKEDYFVDNLGEEHWMLNSKVPIKDAQGNIMGLVGIGRDITDRKKEEIWLKLLESVITNATDGVIITKIDDTDAVHYKIIFVNDAYQKMTGYSREELIGKSPSIVQGLATDTKEIVRVREYLKRFEPCNTEIINYKKDGTAFWSSIAYFPIKDPNGKYKHWIAIKRDITEQKILEQNYLLAKERAESASKAKSEFLANMSHEIRTPLNSVIGFSDLLQKTQLDTTQQQYNSVVFQSANSLLDIINEILDFSKIEAGKLEIDIDKSDILELSYQVSDVVCYQAYKKNLELLLNIGNNVPRFIWTDPIRLRQILINLMGNAVKFTASGEIELKVELAKETDDANKKIIRFSVRDTGIGIKPENQRKIFEAFSQEDASTNRKYGGTGLGLAISKKLLYLMGSELQLISEPQKGSTFFFELEVEVMDGDPEEWNDIEQYKNVLIVDDNANNRLLLREMLALKNIQTDEAENGHVALHLLGKSKKYDLVLMDYNMPEMDGIETVRQIRNNLHLGVSELPIILQHSSAEDELVNAACTALGVAQRLVKPIKMKHLFEAMSKAGNHSKSTGLSNKINTGKHFTRSGFYKVLVVDDNEFNIMLIKKMVSEILPEASIYEAINGKEALTIYTESTPDIIFMDVQMPEMNGHDATRAIRKMEKQNQHIPVIALTAGTQNEEREKCLEAGMDDFVTKPFITNAIVEVINKWLK